MKQWVSDNFFSKNPNFKHLFNFNFFKKIKVLSQPEKMFIYIYTYFWIFIDALSQIFLETVSSQDLVW